MRTNKFHPPIRILTRNGEISESELAGKRCVLALGTFDGVHCAHRALLTKAASLVESVNASLAGAWCFDESPAGVLFGIKVPQLCSLDEKIRLMFDAGIDFVAVGQFKDFFCIDAECFVDTVLKQRLGCICSVSGFNHRFGHNGLGDHALLAQSFGKDLAVNYPEIKIDGETVSSSAIRNHLVNGEIEIANRMLGRNFSFSAQVINGKQLGRKINFPTANQLFPDSMIGLKHGIYATLCTTDEGKTYIGVSNVGTRPTITDESDDHSLNCETFLVNFDGNLYGKNLTVEFCSYLRNERKFDSLEQLSMQIQNDCNKAINFFGK